MQPSPGQEHETNFAPVISQHQLAAMESLGVAAPGNAFHSPQAHESKKCFLLEPTLCVLRLESIHDVTDLLLVNFLLERHEEVRLSQVSVVFRNLVFHDEVIAKRVPGQLANDPMILMQIVTVMCQDQVRNKFFLQFLKLRLNSRMKRREKAITVISDRDLLGFGCSEKQARTFYCFPFSCWIGAEDLPIDLTFRILPQQPQDRPATSDFDIVAMGAQAENAARGPAELTESKS